MYWNLLLLWHQRPSPAIKILDFQYLHWRIGGLFSESSEFQSNNSAGEQEYKHLCSVLIDHGIYSFSIETRHPLSKQKKKTITKKNLAIYFSVSQPQTFWECVNPGESISFNLNHSMTNSEFIHHVPGTSIVMPMRGNYCIIFYTVGSKGLTH